MSDLIRQMVDIEERIMRENAERIILGLEMIVADDKMWRKANFYAATCRDALDLIKTQAARLKELELCRHECKIDCLLEQYNKLSDRLKALEGRRNE